VDAAKIRFFFEWRKRLRLFFAYEGFNILKIFVPLQQKKNKTVARTLLFFLVFKELNNNFTCSEAVFPELNLNLSTFKSKKFQN